MNDDAATGGTGDVFVTLRVAAGAALKVRGSRFIAEAHPVRRREEAEQALGAVRRKYHDATHHCFAYRLATGGVEFRTGDGGEPLGSAGRPILEAIDREGLTDVLVVVTRYFGGTKLGIGNLARAYGEAAALALAAGGRMTQVIVGTLAVSFPHSCIGPVMHQVAALGARITDTRYDEEVHMVLEIRNSRRDELRMALREQTRGAIRFASS